MAQAAGGAPTIPLEEFKARRRQAISMAADKQVDALLVWSRGSEQGGGAEVQYFANHFDPFPWCPPALPELSAFGHSGLLIGPDATAQLFTSGFVSEGAQADRVRSGWSIGRSLLDAIDEAGLTESRIGVIGSENLPYAIGQTIRSQYPKLDLVDADRVGNLMRLRLSEAEIAALRHAGEVGSRIARATLEGAKVGGTEGDMLAAGYSLAVRAPGCWHWSTLVASGPDAPHFVRFSSPPWNPDYTYRGGDSVHFDLFGVVNGYTYDLARTFTVGGSANGGADRAAQGARELCGHLASHLRPGITAAELNEFGVAYLRQHQLDAGDAPSFGHAVGCGFMPPYFMRGTDAKNEYSHMPLHPPMAFAFETFVTDGSGHHAAWEENYIWHDDRVEQITS